MRAQPSLFLIRGLPGAGKSTLAGALSEGRHPVFSVDSYFESGPGKKYEFRFSENHLAYKRCQQQAQEAMESGSEKIFVDNTFTMDWEMEPYFLLASRFGYRVFVITVENRHGGINTHNIPAEQVRKMAEKYRVVLM